MDEPAKMTMDWPWLAERIPVAIGVLKDIALAAAAITTARIGWLALGKWREETVGKRRLELAEEVLADFYQVQEVIREARTPFVDAREMLREEGVPDEVVKSAYYAPERRLRADFGKIVDLRTKRHRFAAVFGQPATAPWDEIENVLKDLDAAGQALLALRGERVPKSDSNAAFYEEQRQTLFRGMEKDPIAPRIERAVRDIEGICRPVIEASIRR